MRWLHSLSFSSPNHSSSSSPSTCSNCSSSTEPNYSRHGKDRSYLRGGALALRFGGGLRFSRWKKLSFLIEQDASIKRNSSNANVEKSPLDSSDVVLTRSTSSSSAVPSRLSTSAPLPLPLPLPAQCGDGESRFPSPVERDRDGGQKHKEKEKEKEREKERIDGGRIGTGDGVCSSPSPISRDRRKTMERLEIKSPNNMHSEFYMDNYLENRASPPAKSAPSSPFSSPLFSPQILSPADLLPYYQMMAKGNQVWSAPEMPTFVISGLPPPAFFDYSAFSSDGSPLHSPSNINLNPISPTGAASPLTRLSIDGSSTGRDGNIEVHPLPLPPGVSKLSPSSPIPQVTVKPDVAPLKSQWQKGKLIGRGTFGSVYVASNRETGALCAMKEVNIFPDDPKSAESIKQLEQEIKVLSQLKHPNIVQYYGSEIVDDHFYIYLEYVHPGSIDKYAREHCGAITENVVRSFTRHILYGLAYLHSMKTIHRDIKAANLLVDASGVVKLADFGMSKLITGQAAELSLKGSPYWMAPELMQAVMQKVNNSDLALAVDIWSLGCTIIEMFTGKPPWSGFEGAAAMFKVLKDTPPIPEALSPEGKDFLSHCFKRNPAERASASMLLEHHWLKNLQQLDAPSSTHSINGMKLKDIAQNPVTSEVKFDQIHSPLNAKGKMVSDSFRTSARVSDIILARLST